MTTFRARAAVLRGALAIPMVIAIGATVPVRAESRPRTPVYEVVELGSLGGAPSGGSSINDRGWVAGFSNPGEEGITHATLWRHGRALDLLTLGGPNSAVLWPVENERGILVGIAETADIDPRREIWSCGWLFPTDTDHVCRGFVWERGTMRPLPTHGGTHGFAAGANNRGQVVGWAETADEDPTCNSPQVLGFHAALWDIRRDRITALPPLPGDDTASAATAINDRGQVVGISGTCANAVGGFSARHAVMWEDGDVIEIGDLGGDAWNTPMAINHRGVVVGFANQAGTEADRFNEEAFIWTERHGIRPLGMLPGDVRSQALGLNDRGDVVGLSRGTAGTRAVIWRDDVMTDLNTAAPGYDGHLDYANDINDAGVITGQARNAETGELVAFVATPTRRR
ncbi:MAG: hypothetical protein ACRD0A_21300 [Acidimicrobiales bacterium]